MPIPQYVFFRLALSITFVPSSPRILARKGVFKASLTCVPIFHDPISTGLFQRISYVSSAGHTLSYRPIIVRKNFVKASLTRLPIFLDTEYMGLLERISYVSSADHTLA